MISLSNEYDLYSYEMGFQHGSKTTMLFSPTADRFYKMGFNAARKGVANTCYERNTK